MSENVNAEIRKAMWGGWDVPADALVYWSARAIYHPRDTRPFDCLGDRQAMEGSDDDAARKELGDWINHIGMQVLADKVHMDYVMPNDDVEVSYGDERFTIKGNPKRSHGYFYILAYAKPRKPHPMAQFSGDYLNPDGWPDGELAEFRNAYLVKGAEAALFPSKPRGFKKAASLIDSYVSGALKAREFRKSGNIDGALIMERQMEMVYNKLPKFARW